MKAYFASLTLVLLISQFACAQSTGSVCVASRADDPFWKEPIPPSGEINSHGLRVKVDKRAAMAWPQTARLQQLSGVGADRGHDLAKVIAGCRRVEPGH